MSTRIYPIPMGFDTIYALQGEGTILIDAGDPGKMANFNAGLAKASINPSDIRLIVLTHGHWDHVGSTREIKELTGAQVLLHQRDLHFLEDLRPTQPPGFTPWGKFLIQLVTVIADHKHIPSFDVDLVVDGEFSLADYGIPGRAFPTPGHSWGSMSVLLDSGEAFVGDLAMNMFPMRLSPGFPIFGDDLSVVKNSWRKLLDLGARTVYPSHGKPFPADVMRRAVV